MQVNCIIDSGADVSIISYRTVRELDIKLLPHSDVIQGRGQLTPIKTLGKCSVYVILPHVNIEIEFHVVPDNVVGDGIDVLIGLDVIRRPSLQLTKINNIVDLIPSECFVSRVRVLNSSKKLNIVWDLTWVRTRRAK